MNDLEINKYLNKITSSEVFVRSSIYKKLLEYLTEATLKEEKPKEITIGIDVFNHSPDDPSTSNIRVHIHKLRKNLAVYYSKEGIKDSIRFKIPKGGYSIAFENRRHVATKKGNRKILVSLLALVFVGLLLNVYFFVSQKTDYSGLKRTSFWHEIFNKDKETVVVVGNYFMFRDMKRSEDHGQIWNIRDIQINTEQGLKDYINSTDRLNTDDYKELKDVAYLSFDVFRILPYLIPLFYENEVNYQIVTSTDFKWYLYDDCNVVYIGSFKNLQSISLITDKLNITFDNETFTLKCDDPDKPRMYTPYVGNNIEVMDYALVAKIPRSNNNAIYLFASTHGIGSIETVNYFSDPGTLKTFEEDFLKPDKYFKAIFKTEGIERSIESFNMENYKAINDSSLYNFWHY